MKIKYLGTAASEGIPGVFCNCKLCKKARDVQGREIRTRSSALLNDDFLFDLPPDSYAQSLKFGHDLSKIGTIAVTHTHTDHFYPQQLIFRGSWFAHGMKCDSVNIVSNTEAVRKMEMFTQEEMTDEVKAGIHNIIPELFVPAVSCGYEITALPARHKPDETAFVYVVKKDGKTILYLHDTGFLYDDVLDYLDNKNIRPDLVSFDCTGGLSIRDGIGHMGFDDVLEQRRILFEREIINDENILVINHFSHNCLNTYSELCEAAEKNSFVAAYDGLEIEF